MTRVQQNVCVALATFLILQTAAAWEIQPIQAEAAAKLAEPTEHEQDVVDRTNTERKAAKLPAFTVDPALSKLAREHSANMARLDQLSHELEGKPFAKRLEAAGYRFAAAGENIAQGQRTPVEAVTTWMNSAGHKANILNPKYTHIGVGIAMGKSGSPYYTQIFAAPIPRAE